MSSRTCQWCPFYVRWVQSTSSPCCLKILPSTSRSSKYTKIIVQSGRELQVLNTEMFLPEYHYFWSLFVCPPVMIVAPLLQKHAIRECWSLCDSSRLLHPSAVVFKTWRLQGGSLNENIFILLFSFLILPYSLFSFFHQIYDTFKYLCICILAWILTKPMYKLERKIVSYFSKCNYVCTIT
jgi:hypothetical protein